MSEYRVTTRTNPTARLYPVLTREAARQLIANYGTLAIVNGQELVIKDYGFRGPPGEVITGRHVQAAIIEAIGYLQDQLHNFPLDRVIVQGPGPQPLNPQ